MFANCPRFSSPRRGLLKNWLPLLVLLAGLLFPASVSAQGQGDQAAAMVLNSARKAFNDKDYPFAVARFREFLSRYGGHPEAPAARYALALALLEGPEKKFDEARDLLQGLTNQKDNLDPASVHYHLGLAMRAQGIHELDQADARPGEANQRRASAQNRFNEALAPLAVAMKIWEANKAEATPAGKDLSVTEEWLARVRCDQGELLLRLNKAKEAQALVAGFVKDPILSRSRYRDQGRYFFAFASFLLKDYATAQQVLTMAPATNAPGSTALFQDPHFGTHARYLLARTHHLANERGEAQFHYEKVITDHAKAKENASQLLRQPERFKNDPAERARLEALVRNPPPDHVARSTFYLGVLVYEAGRFGEAMTRFAEFPKLYPQSPLRPEADLRIGFCQVQMKSFADAIKTLSPLVDKEPRLADQVLFWLGKAQAGAADPTNPQAQQQALNNALNTLRQALERAQRAANQQDPEATQRRAEILLDIADTQQLLKQHREAIQAYNQLLNEKMLPEREEEILQRLALALHLAGDFNESDKQCQVFQEKFPRSTLLPAVLFCFGENNYFRALALEKSSTGNERAKELAQLYEETGKRLSPLVEKYPEFARINLARYTLGLTYYRQGNLLKAKQTLEAIPGPDRSGELALVPYLLADCIMRQTPTAIPEDALAAGKMEEQLKTAEEMLEAFIGGGMNPQTADALLKLGLVQQRLASLLAQPEEKNKALTKARENYKKLLGREFSGNPAVPQAMLENAKCQAMSRDMNRAIHELQQFTNDPWKNSNVAPMALIHLATLLRGQNKAAEAASILARSREWHEAGLSKDPERSAWLPLLRYHHGAALREAGKLPEARAVFEMVIKQVPTRLEGMEAALRYGQCLKDEGLQKLAEYRKLQGSGKKLDDTAQRLLEDGFKDLRAAAQFLEGQIEQLKAQETGQETRARMLYEAAWVMRILAEPEVQAARTAVAQEMMKKIGSPAISFSPPDVPPEKVPWQPAEIKARELYQSIIKMFGDVPLATDVRFELAELLAQRQEFEPAEKLLVEVLDKEPSPDLTDKVRIRLGEIQAVKGNLKAAQTQFEAIAGNPKSAMFGQAKYRAAEVHMANKNWPEAIKCLILFRDQQQLQNQWGLTDRALLRLGHALAETKNWDESRRAFERLLNSFGGSPWADESRYGMAYALQQQRQFDQAVHYYNQVKERTASELGAKAQLQIGLCRLEQKKYPEAVHTLLIVPTTYGYPELSANALLEAARAHTKAKQNDQAVRLLDRVLREYPNTPWALAAGERLKTLRGEEDKK